MRTKSPLRLTVELLERRELLSHATEPTITFSDDSLIIHGTGGDDEIDVFATAAGEVCATYKIPQVGLFGGCTPPTSPDTKKIIIDTYGGDDDVFLKFVGGTVESVRIRTHRGDDRIRIQDSTVGTDESPKNYAVAVSSGAGADWVQMSRTQIEGNMRVVAGGGDDEVRLRQSQVEGRLLVNGRVGSDAVMVDQVEVMGKARFVGSTGADAFSILRSQFDSSLRIVGGAGDDRVKVRDSYVGADLQLYGGTGDDCLDVLRAEVDGMVNAAGGPGHDTFIVNDSEVLGGGTVLMGGGDDTVGIYNTTLGDTLTLNGQSGAGDGLLAGLVDQMLLSWSNFENVDFDSNRLWCFEAPGVIDELGPGGSGGTGDS